MRVDVGDAELEVEVSGPETAPAVLCWNGATVTLRQWDKVRERLDDRFRFVCFNVRGIGHSGIQKDSGVQKDSGDQFTFEQYASDVNEVLDALGIESVITLSMAWGSRAALVHAALYPHRVERAALFDLSIATADPEAQKAGRQIALANQDATGIERFGRPDNMADHLDASLVRSALAATAKTDLAALLPQLTMPLLLATGDHDPNLVSTRDVAAAVPHATFEVLTNVGHASVLQRPDLACDLFAEFAVAPRSQRQPQPPTR